MNEPGRPRSVSRRLEGLALVGLAALCLLAARAVVAAPILGSPIPLPVPGPPTVGDCVMQPIDPTWNQTKDPTTGEQKPYTYPQLPMQPCSGDKFEVTSVITNPKPLASSETPEGQITTSDPNIGTCLLSALRFYGMPFSGAQQVPLAGQWYPSFSANVAAVRPSPRQLAARQPWLACVVYQAVDIDSTQPAAPQERYSRTFRNAYTGGPQRNAIATCFAAQVGEDPAECSQPHHLEAFSFSGTDRPTPRKDLQSTCIAAVKKATAIASMPGGLTVAVSATDSDSQPITAAIIPAGAQVTCSVSSTRTLTGSLLAVGNGPIPWG